MLFNSLAFAVFFPLVTVLYFALPHRWRTAMLLIASCWFYMALIPKYVVILFFLILVDYFAGIWIAEAKGRRRKQFLILSLGVNVGILALFKYNGFFVENINVLLGSQRFNPWSMALPIGLSFHTFQSMSYTIEVYRGTVKPERNLWTYALYVMFYPQLVAGPIERPQNLLPQLHERHRFDRDRFWLGLRMMAFGLYKKIFIADVLAIFVDQVYNDPTRYSGWPLICATYAFSIQIFCDFSGYTDIARGAAKVMGFDLMVNFNMPYLSRSISEFWSRWHISLSTWFRDYLYIPLGGNRVSKPRWYMNLMVVFLVSGFWHGAKWTFVAWGLIHGIYLVTALLTESFRAKLPRPPALLSIFITFNLVSFAWIFFRANSMADSLYIVTHLFQFMEGVTVRGLLQQSKLTTIGIPLVSVALWLGYRALRGWRPSLLSLGDKPFAVRACVYMVGALIAVQLSLIYIMGRGDRAGAPPQQFIYFQF